MKRPLGRLMAYGGEEKRDDGGELPGRRISFRKKGDAHEQDTPEQSQAEHCRINGYFTSSDDPRR